MKPTALFVIGGVSKPAKQEGTTITDDDLATLDNISERAGVDANIAMACESPATHGRDPSMAEVRAERARLLDAIAHSGADFVIAFGKTPVRSLWDKGSMKTSSLRMKRHVLPDVALPVHVVNSLEEMAFKPGLRNWAGLEVLRAVAGEIPVTLGDYHVQQEIHPELLAYLSDGLPNKEVTVDLETFPGLDPYAPDARVRMVVVSHRSGFAQVIQAGPASELPAWVVDLLRNPSVLKIGSHIRFDVRWLKRFGYEVVNYFCTEHYEHLLDENAGIRDLKTLSLRYHPTLGDYSAGQRALVEERTVRDKKGKIIEDGWRHIKDEEMYDYAGGDGDAGITIFKAQSARCLQDDLARPLAAMREYYPAISRLEMAGACVDMRENAVLKERYIEELSRLKGEIRGYLGANINPRSPAQLIPALQEYAPNIDLRKVMWKKKDDEDNPYSTEAAVLRREAAKNPVIRVVLDFRRRAALYNFVSGMAKHVVRVAGHDYVFSSLRGDITATYRHSSSRPNLQNLPRSVDAESEAGLNVKRQYVSRFEGGSIREYDQAQLELREAGMIAGDDALIEAFASGEDIHTTLAAMMRGIDASEVTEEIRQNGKTTNFHVLYGGGPFGLALRLGCSSATAQSLVAQFDDTFHGYRRWERGQHNLAMTRLWTESRYGFRRRFQKPVEWASPLGRYIKRQAANAPIQGGASTTVNLGIAKVLRLFDAAGLRSVPFLTVHDSLLVDTYPGEEEVVDRFVREGMEHPDTEKYGVVQTIPLVVECKAGSSWGEIKKLAVK